MIAVEDLHMERSLLSAKQNLLIGLCLLIAGVASGQDMTFSQYYFNRAMINPSYVGESGSLTFSSVHKQQWTRLPDRTFNDMHLSSVNAEIGCPRYNLAMGMNIQYTEEGAGRFSQLYGAYTISYNINGDWRKPIFRSFKRRKFIVSFGAQIGVGQKMLDWSRLTFSDQFDPYTSIVTPSRIFTSGITDVSTMEPDLSFGLKIKTQLPNKRSALSAGVALFHINKPKETFLYTDNRIPQRLSIHGFWYRKLKRKLYSKYPIFSKLGVAYNYHLPLGGISPPLAASALLLSGLSVQKNDLDVGIRIDPIERDVTSIILVYLQTIDEQWNLSFGMELNTSEFTFNQAGLTFDLGVTYTFKEVYICKVKNKKREWCHDAFSHNTFKYGPKYIF